MNTSETRETKEILARALKEKTNRYLTNRASFYTPHNKQKIVHLDTTKERWCFTGNRFGKTTLGVLECYWHSTGLYPDWYPVAARLPQPCQIRIVCTDFVNGIEKVILPEIKKWFPLKCFKNSSFESSYSRLTRILTMRNGSTIDLMSFDQAPQAFAGPSRHFIWQDEHGPKAIYEENKMRLIDTGGRFLGTLTPIDGMSWEFDEIFEKAEARRIKVFRGATSDNPINTLSDIDDLTRGLDIDKKRVRLYGDFLNLTGLIFKEYDEDVSLIDDFDIPKTWTRYCGIDPHPRHPTAVLYLAVSPNDDIYIYDELYLGEKTVKEICETMKAQQGKDVIHTTYIDPSADADNELLGANIRNDFMKHGIYCIRGERNLSEGIERIRQVLKPEYSGILKKHVSRAKVFKSCVNLRYELRHYVWDEFARRPEDKDPKQKPKSKNDHFISALRYVLMSDPGYLFEDEEASEVTYSRDGYIPKPSLKTSVMLQRAR